MSIFSRSPTVSLSPNPHSVLLPFTVFLLRPVRFVLLRSSEARGQRRSAGIVRGTIINSFNYKSIYLIRCCVSPNHYSATNYVSARRPVGSSSNMELGSADVSPRRSRRTAALLHSRERR